MHKGVLTYNEIILSLSLHLNRSYTSYKLINYVVVLQFDEMMNYLRFTPTIQLIDVLFLIYTHHSVDCCIVYWLKCCRISRRNRSIYRFHAKTRPCKNIRRCNCCCLLRQFTIIVTCVRSWWLQKWCKIASSQSLHPWHRRHLQSNK